MRSLGRGLCFSPPSKVCRLRHIRSRPHEHGRVSQNLIAIRTQCVEGTEDCSGPQRMQLVPSEALDWRRVVWSGHVKTTLHWISWLLATKRDHRENKDQLKPVNLRKAEAVEHKMWDWAGCEGSSFKSWQFSYGVCSSVLLVMMCGVSLAG